MSPEQAEAIREALSYMPHRHTCDNVHKDAANYPTGYSLGKPCSCGRDDAVEAMIATLARAEAERVTEAGDG